jgi:transcriptional regulator with XRE-family HTH domain
MAHDEPATEPTPTHTLGPFLKKRRLELKMTLRDVEDATDKEVSNAYLSQLEGGKIIQPSPHILYSLSTVLNLPYEGLMERAGYIVPAANRPAGAQHGRAATFAIDNLSAEEESELLDYLNYIRSKRK